MTNYCRSDVVTADLGEELAVLDLDSGSYLGFNATAAYTWRLLEEPHSLDSLCEAVMAEFDVDSSHCRKALTDLLTKLEADGLVVAVAD